MSDNRFLGKVNPVEASKIINRETDGDPIFTVQDICETTHPLAQMLRYFLAIKRVTKNMLKRMHRKLAIETCMSTNKTSFDFSNMYRSISQHEATWQSTEKVLHVMGEELIDLVYVLRNNETGEISEIRRSDAIKAISEHPYPSNLLMERVDKINENNNL